MCRCTPMTSLAEKNSLRILENLSKFLIFIAKRQIHRYICESVKILGFYYLINKDFHFTENKVHGHIFTDKIGTINDKEQEEGLNNRPIIGILAQECQPHFPVEICSTSYIAASYVKYIESAGARVVPVLINQPEEYYRIIFNSTNGILIPGGRVSISDSGVYTRDVIYVLW